MVQDGINGYLVGLNGEEEFVDRAVSLAQDLKLRKRISSEARKVFITFSVSVITDKWEYLLNKKGK